MILPANIGDLISDIVNDNRGEQFGATCAALLISYEECLIDSGLPTGLLELWEAENEFLTAGIRWPASLPYVDEAELKYPGWLIRQLVDQKSRMVS